MGRGVAVLSEAILGQLSALTCGFLVNRLVENQSLPIRIFRQTPIN
jgi:hypothetical protein